ncbi:dystrobrevin beta-like isoform X2 [Hydractinia symbiolongicarpus]|nr:dystrobrevin beta-like isoform X2 [Hydractinia symbiolongicarpus]XP_057303271.1 dystrobrevin beta-like isoform X2 [Hydractinia symbiolongicarpus]XP_057303272.1 dystrobrevin beta-like isoform X2 [Hydractinia symbiolongicarpus]
MNSPALYHRSISLNGTMNKKHGNALKKFLIEMKSKNFDDIKRATNRAAAKLFFVQRATSLYLVDIYNIIEAFRENGLNTLDHSAELDEPRLECIIASIYYALYKRLPSTHAVDVENCIEILTQWIMHTYDSDGIGRIRVLSVKTALSTLCEGRLIDKFRYVFTQISESNGILSVAKLDNYLRDLLTLPCAVGEEPNFSYSEDILDSFFQPGALNRTHTKLDDFLNAFMNENANGVLLWLHMFNKISKASCVEHAILCKGCGKKDFTGLRYKCLTCYNYQLCQDCFWRERVSGSHKADHDMKEYSSWNKGEKGTSVRKRLLCSPSKASGQKLPDYPKEPEPNKTLDLSNIVPPLPSSEPNSPNATLTRTPRFMMGSVSQHSNLSRTSSTKYSQDSVTRQDDEHRLISLYAQRLAEDSLNRKSPSKTSSSSITASEPTSEQKELISNLEERNKSLLSEIRLLKAEHEEAIQNAQQMGCDPNLLTELHALRQRKDELEMRMSALQETRRELMVQLEGLMKLLKHNQMNSPRHVTRVASGAGLSEMASKRPSGPPAGGNSLLMRGVNGEVKEAFGKTTVKEGSCGQDLRVDLMTAVEEVTTAMTSVVKELKDGGRTTTSSHATSCNDDAKLTDIRPVNSTQINNTEVRVY